MKILLGILTSILDALFKNVIREVKKPVKAKDAPISPDRERFLERMREHEGSLRGLSKSDSKSRPKGKG